MFSETGLMGVALIRETAKFISVLNNIPLDVAEKEAKTAYQMHEYFDGEPVDPEQFAIFVSRRIKNSVK
jgi:hypothetical protein